MAQGKSKEISLTHRYREQAHSYRGLALFVNLC